MKYLSTLLLIGFIGLVVFGVFGMHVEMQNHNGGCIVATARGMYCPKQSNPVDYLTFHLYAFKNFLTATLSDVASSLLFFSLLAIGIFFSALLVNLTPPKFAYCRLKRSDSFSPPSQYELIRWLALHENSPATP